MNDDAPQTAPTQPPPAAEAAPSAPATAPVSTKTKKAADPAAEARKSERRAARQAATDAAVKAAAELKPFVLDEDAFGQASGDVVYLSPAKLAAESAKKDEAVKMHPATADDLALFGRTPKTVH